MKYSLSLALVDYVPVIGTLLGQWLLITLLGDHFRAVWALAVCGALMMFSGGFLKASWKTIIATTGKDIRWMEHALFPLLAPGACLFASAIWSARHTMKQLPAFNGWLFSLGISAIFLCWSIRRFHHGTSHETNHAINGESKPAGKWFLPLVALLTLSMGAITINAALIATYRNSKISALLFIGSFLISLITTSVSRKAATIKIQWIMEISNSLSALIFVTAVLFL